MTPGTMACRIRDITAIFSASSGSSDAARRAKPFRRFPARKRRRWLPAPGAHVDCVRDREFQPVQALVRNLHDGGELVLLRIVVVRASIQASTDAENAG